MDPAAHTRRDLQINGENEARDEASDLLYLLDGDPQLSGVGVQRMPDL